jgi:hypothetical protein
MHALTPFQIRALIVAGIYAGVIVVAAALPAVVRWVRRRRAKHAIRQQLELLRGGRPAVFTSAGHLETRAPRPSAPRASGDPDAA